MISALIGFSLCMFSDKLLQMGSLFSKEAIAVSNRIPFDTLLLLARNTNLLKDLLQIVHDYYYMEGHVFTLSKPVESPSPYDIDVPKTHITPPTIQLNADQTTVTVRKWTNRMPRVYIRDPICKTTKSFLHLQINTLKSTYLYPLFYMYLTGSHSSGYWGISIYTNHTYITVYNANGHENREQIVNRMPLQTAKFKNVAINFDLDGHKITFYAGASAVPAQQECIGLICLSDFTLTGLVAKEPHAFQHFYCSFVLDMQPNDTFHIL